MKIHHFTIGALLMALAGGEAQASHKNWLLRNSGNQCSFQFPSAANDTFTDSLTNWGGYRWAVCPVSLAGRWGSSGNVSFSPTRNAQAMWANLYLRTPSANSCHATAKMGANGATYWSRSVVSTKHNGALNTMAIQTPVGNWGGSLEANENAKLMSLDFECGLSTTASIVGYKVKLCQQGVACDDERGNDEDVDSSDGYWAPVQTSGLECVAQNNYGDIRIGALGIRNWGTKFTWEDRVHCPITQPSDDSYSHLRSVRGTRVHFRGPSSGYKGCANNFKCPQCFVTWTNRHNLYSRSAMLDAPFTGSGYVELPGVSTQIGEEISLSVECELPPGFTLVGTTSELSLTRKSGGI